MKKTARLLFLTLFLLSNILSPLARAETVDINATVPANSTDFSAELITTTTGDVFPQDTTLSYELTYGSSLSYASTVVVEATWSRGTVEGDSSPTVSVLDYVPGSASNAYNNTSPVIDPVNRTIRWTIIALPANTQDQKVTFDLKTTSNYTGEKEVSFTVTGRVLGPGTATPDSSVTKNYLYDISLAPTPTPTPTPTTTPTPTSLPATPTSMQVPTATPTPSTPVSVNAIDSVVIREITSSTAKIYISTHLPSTTSLLYGTSPTSLTQRITEGTRLTQHLFTLSNLLPNTTYYFLIQATTASEMITSDIYTITTAKIPPSPTPSITSLVVTSGDTILYNNSAITKEHVFGLMLPTAISYTLRLNISNMESLSGITLLTRDQLNQNEGEIEMNEVSNGTYQGRVFSSQNPSRLDLLVRLISHDGSIIEKRLGSVRVVTPMRLVNERTQESIEGGRVELSYWNSRENRFVPLNSNLIPQSTLFSTNNGIVPFILPEGRYKAKISHMGFEEKEVDFTIGDDADAGYPTIELKETGFTILLLITYLWTIAKDFFNALTNNYLDPLTSSVRFYHLLAASSLLALSSLSMFSFFSRSKLTPAHLPIFLLYHFTKNHHSETLSVSGIVVDHETTHPLSHANVYLFDEHSDKIIAHSVSSLQGKYHFTNIPVGTYRISVLKTGFHPFVIHRTLTQNDTSQLHLAISRKEIPFPLHQKVLHLAEGFFSSTFEAWLLLSFLLLALVGMSIGWEKIVGFLAIALFNLTMWSVHRSNVTKS